mmetsp:Transcript_15844/g.39050  ORF Transcript_15844/g.39050 Transcript_15844/m.39050 type:complete len:895 (-) Transcript_15844:69-2753(-)
MFTSPFASTSGFDMGLLTGAGLLDPTSKLSLSPTNLNILDTQYKPGPEAEEVIKLFERDILDIVTPLGFSVGELWVPNNKKGCLVNVGIKSVDQQLESVWRGATKSYNFHEGKGIVGRIHARKTVEWCENLAEVDTQLVPRAKRASHLGVVSAFGFPGSYGNFNFVVILLSTKKLQYSSDFISKAEEMLSRWDDYGPVPSSLKVWDPKIRKQVSKISQSFRNYFKHRVFQSRFHGCELWIKDDDDELWNAASISNDNLEAWRKGNETVSFKIGEGLVGRVAGDKYSEGLVETQLHCKLIFKRAVTAQKSGVRSVVGIKACLHKQGDEFKDMNAVACFISQASIPMGNDIFDACEKYITEWHQHASDSNVDLLASLPVGELLPAHVKPVVFGKHAPQDLKHNIPHFSPVAASSNSQSKIDVSAMETPSRLQKKPEFGIKHNVTSLCTDSGALPKSQKTLSNTPDLFQNLHMDAQTIAVLAKLPVQLDKEAAAAAASAALTAISQLPVDIERQAPSQKSIADAVARSTFIVAYRQYQEVKFQNRMRSYPQLQGQQLEGSTTVPGSQQHTENGSSSYSGKDQLFQSNQNQTQQQQSVNVNTIFSEDSQAMRAYQHQLRRQQQMTAFPTYAFPLQSHPRRLHQGDHSSNAGDSQSLNSPQHLFGQQKFQNESISSSQNYVQSFNTGNIASKTTSVSASSRQAFPIGQQMFHEFPSQLSNKGGKGSGPGFLAGSNHLIQPHNPAISSSRINHGMEMKNRALPQFSVLRQAMPRNNRKRKSFSVSPSLGSELSSEADNEPFTSLESEVKGSHRHICEHCGKKFAKKGNWRAHVRVHTKEKPFACSICRKAFSQKSNMKRHIKSHEKVFGKSVVESAIKSASSLPDPNPKSMKEEIREVST